MSYGHPPPPQPGQQPPQPPFPSAQDPSQGAPYQHWPQSPGPEGYGHPQPPKKSRTGLIVTLSVVGGVAVLLALGVLIAVLAGDNSPSGRAKPPVAERPGGGASATEGAPAPDDASGAPTELPALEGTDGTGDVRITRCEVDSLTEWPDADVEIVNHSGAQASYIVSVEFVDGEGTRRASGLATATDLAAGRKSVQKAQGLGKVPGRMTCRVSKVTRLPSS
ncbi:hypothetical protein ACWCXX_01435 [Streptomyces sp. NPDC001732]